MATLTFENLDLACAKAGKTIAPKPSKEVANIATNALAVLEEQGVYALFLYLESAKGDEQVGKGLHAFLKRTPGQKPLVPENTEDVLAAVRDNLTNDLDKLLLARDLLRQTLVYARYHARLREESEDTK